MSSSYKEKRMIEGRVNNLIGEIWSGAEYYNNRLTIRFASGKTLSINPGMLGVELEVSAKDRSGRELLSAMERNELRERVNEVRREKRRQAEELLASLGYTNLLPPEEDLEPQPKIYASKGMSVPVPRYVLDERAGKEDLDLANVKVLTSLSYGRAPRNMNGVCTVPKIISNRIAKQKKRGIKDKTYSMSMTWGGCIECPEWTTSYCKLISAVNRDEAVIKWAKCTGHFDSYLEIEKATYWGWKINIEEIE